MLAEMLSPLAEIEPRLRVMLPADLYVTAWMTPSTDTLMAVFKHLRTLQRILHDYVPRQLSAAPPAPGELRRAWQEGTLMFTDLVGFTPLMEANAARGRTGAETLLAILNNYFAAMIEIISKSGGDLLEFTGDALLAQFPAGHRRSDTVRAVRAGLRMQRAMNSFANIETPLGAYSLQMRVGIHPGRFLTADIGTPRRMEHVLLGDAVHIAKLAEGAGAAGRVCLTAAAHERVREHFRVEAGEDGHSLVVDDFTDAQIGEYDLVPPRRRAASSVLWDLSIESLITEINKELKSIESLASFLPMSVLNLVVESAARREITPDFPRPTVMFVNLKGLAEYADSATAEEEQTIIAGFSHAIALINAAVEARGGILKKVTYHLTGSDMLICFGVPVAHTNDSYRAAEAALAIRDLVAQLVPLSIGGKLIEPTCQIGMARGSVFAAEIGEPRGRREFNVLGDAVNTAARLMKYAQQNQILLTESVYEEIRAHVDCVALGAVSLKGKAAAMSVFALRNT